MEMFDNHRLVEILQSFGSLEETPLHEQGALRSEPFLLEGIWTIPIDDSRCLRVNEQALPPAVAQLLALYVQSMAAELSDPRSQVEQMLTKWLAESGELVHQALAKALQTLGWEQQGAILVVLERVKSQENDAFELADAIGLLNELLDEDEAFVVRQGETRIYLLLARLQTEAEGPDRVSACLDTLSAELYLLFRAAVSAPLSDWNDLPRARKEAEFAMEAGKRYRTREMIHDAKKLGLARLLYGLPSDVRAAFLQEMLPDHVLNSLSPELRETIFAFLEHGQQLADTARFLYIHRNTLQYRLERISELTGYDIRQPLQGWTLWMALTMIRSL